MNFTLNQLRIFLKVVETESITKAAEALHLTQPAVSIQLKNFQEQFDVALTEVIHRRLYITDFGREVARSVETIMNEVYAVQYKSAIYRGRLTGRLKLSSVSTGKYVIPYFLADFKREHPDVEISLDVTNKSSVIAQLENNEVDFALVSILPDSFAVNSIDLMDNELYLIGAGHSEISSVQFADLADNRKIPLIYREHGSGTARTMEQFLSSGEVLIPQTMRLTSNETVKQAVLAGLGYSVMPLIGITNELKDGRLKIIECPGLPIKTKWRLITLARKKLSPVAEAFSEFVGKEKDRIITERFALPGNIPGLQKH